MAIRQDDLIKLFEDDVLRINPNRVFFISFVHFRALT